MAYFKIEYGCGCGDAEEYCEFENQEVANHYAYEAAISDYESYEGLHGIRGMCEIAEEDFDISLDDIEDYNTALYIDIETAYIEERENCLSYSAIEITEEEWKEYWECD